MTSEGQFLILAPLAEGAQVKVWCQAPPMDGKPGQSSAGRGHKTSSWAVAQPLLLGTTACLTTCALLGEWGTMGEAT
jgi:hypothetical protein